ncbi:hypothetical protein Tco_1351194 [Tanacetum coccineum]
MQTPISTPPRSPSINLSLDKTIFEELTATISPTTATTSKAKSKRGFALNKTKILSGSIATMCRRRGQIRTHIKTKFVTYEFFMGKIQEVLDHCNSVVPKLTFAKTNQNDQRRNAKTGQSCAHDPYTIVDKPNTSLMYLNSKDEKQVMYLVEIVKFCDATLEKVLKEVKLGIFQNEFGKKVPLLGELDLDIMKAYERE